MHLQTLDLPLDGGVGTEHVPLDDFGELRVVNLTDFELRRGGLVAVQDLALGGADPGDLGAEARGRLGAEPGGGDEAHKNRGGGDDVVTLEHAQSPRNGRATTSLPHGRRGERSGICPRSRRGSAIGGDALFHPACGWNSCGVPMLPNCVSIGAIIESSFWNWIIRSRSGSRSDSASIRATSRAVSSVIPRPSSSLSVRYFSPSASASASNRLNEVSAP